MEYLVIGLAAIFTSGLTLFSGFGLGTLLMPIFAIFFPVEIAVALTAIVHFLNNIFKLALVGRFAHIKTIIYFGLPAIITSFIGASLLVWFSHSKPLYTYALLNHTFHITALKLIIAALMIFFALFEILPRFEHISFDKKYLPIGGILSGFLGGLSGHQGALRSAFLIRSGLEKQSYIATGVVIACLVDFARIFVYSESMFTAAIKPQMVLLIVAVLSAFLGAFIGNRLMKKVTIKSIQILVSILIFIISILLALGII